MINRFSNSYIYDNYDDDDYDNENISSLVKQEIKIDYELQSAINFERKELNQIKKEYEFYKSLREIVSGREYFQKWGHKLKPLEISYADFI